MATAVRSARGMERKMIRISGKRQITIPQKYFDMLGFDTEAECILRGNELVIRPVSERSGGEFAEVILADLIQKGYQGDTLLAKFKETQRKVRPAVETMIAEADKLAAGDECGASLDDLFGAEEQ